MRGAAGGGVVEMLMVVCAAGAAPGNTIAPSRTAADTACR